MTTTYKERDLQWKFRHESTVELEYKLMSANWMTPAEQADIEFELVRRGSTYIRSSYYDRPSKFFGSDGSSLSIATAGQETGRTIYDWDNIIAAEAAYVDRIMAKPIPSATSSEMGSFLKDQTAMIRRVVPGLISMDSISGVQPMAKHINILPFFKAMKTSPFEDYALSKEAITGIIAADKDLQPVQGNFWSDRQSIGRGQRPTVHFGDLHIRDYMGLLHTTESPKSSTAITKLMESIKQSEATQTSFFDTESTFATTAISGDYFSKIDTSKWMSEYKESMDKFIEDAMTLRRPYYADIMDDSVSLMYPNTLRAIDLSLGNKCMEIPITPMMKGAEMTSVSTNFDDIWKLQLEAMKKSTRALYYSNPLAVITTKAPRDSGRLMVGTSEGIYPERKPFIQDFFIGEMATYKADTTISVHAEVNALSSKSEMTVTFPKKREVSSGKLEVKFDYDHADALWTAWAKEDEAEKPDRVSETLALLGIGEK